MLFNSSSDIESAGELENRLKETPNMRRLRKKRRTQGMRDHQSRNTKIRLMAPIRKRAFARKHGRNVMKRL